MTRSLFPAQILNFCQVDNRVLKEGLIKVPMCIMVALGFSGLEGDALNQVVNLAKEGHFQKACSTQFKATHKGQELSTAITEHPNQYYQESVNGGPKVAETNKARANLKTERVNMY